MFDFTTTYIMLNQRLISWQ
ncbi:hypothetical protein PUN28_010855 [Cardiocondyla obscurior]|uniref:Uncharacterized protein n=1 Tax=Cardiocondyla obscurior TaxID=286306 RepID=A0AAW2FI40_9HYME